MTWARPRPAQRMRTARQLIADECANYVAGACLMTDRTCAQRAYKSLICAYFRDCVLPNDKDLCAWVMSGDSVRPCARCGRLFRAVDSDARRCRRCTERRGGRG